MSKIDTRYQGFSTFLQLERTARHAESRSSLGFTIVNETRRLIAFRQAAFLLVDSGGRRARVEAVSGVAVLDRNAPYLRWLEAVARHVQANRDLATGVVILSVDDLPAELARDWDEFAGASILLCPMALPDGHRVGLLWLVRDGDWDESDTVLLERLAECYAHAWVALLGRRSRVMGARLPKIAGAAIGLSLAVLLLVPVRQSALAPAQVVAADPTVMAAPMDGVVRAIHVDPNQAVAEGAPLFSFDDTSLRNNLEIAERSLSIAEAEHRQTAQGAFRDSEATARLAFLEAQIALRRAERDYARELLGWVTVAAPVAGVVVLHDKNDWIGRPVSTGQRIMMIADPLVTELRIMLPVADAISLEPGAQIDLFLDVSPASPVPATLVSAAYEAEETPSGQLAYRVTASFDDETAPRLGLRGTAKIFGDPAPLFIHLFRRPVSGLRQWLGL